jgi:hypothetical protein
MKISAKKSKNSSNERHVLKTGKLLFLISAK